MAIRPVDLQLSIVNQVQTAAQNARAEAAPAIAQQANVAAFAQQVEQRGEQVTETEDATGNRINAKADRDADGHGGETGERRRHGLDAMVDDAAGLPDGETHLIDFSA